ncbi:MAG: leucine--tRNA ligase [Cytophagales bacterium]|nr:leucine--tRNA ligase [Cytophagales bacterium]
MAEYNFREIEQKWQKYWKENQTFVASNTSEKPKYYALDMFPYPSGAGLHVGHPLGYIASDIISRYKRLQGFNVLHPMGFDSFGLPAEQYALQTGQHPAITTEQNLARYKEQLANIGFSYDWDREIRTSSPEYYKWTQWIFIQLFNSWYNNDTDKAENISSLIAKFEENGTVTVNASSDEETTSFSAEEWKAFSEIEQQNILLQYRLAYLSNITVNWCPALGTVLANDEVINGLSERGGHPVERKEMKQWVLRITAYSNRLLEGLEKLDWTDALKEQQRNWIGKSYGCSLNFKVDGQELNLTVFTTRIDTSFGVTYLSVAPESELVDTLTTAEQKAEVEAYVTEAKNRSERDRMSDVKTVSGVFTGSYAINPMNGKRVPIWVADYVLAGYGTGVVMAVPSSDERDYRFASKFELEIIPVQEGEKTDITKDDFDAKAGTMINSDFLNGLTVPKAIQKAIEFVEEKGFGEAKVNFKMRDAIFSRQRYWGEPIPIYYKDGVPYPLEDTDLPLELPEVDDYKPTETGEPPLGRAKNWVTKEGYPLELNTMPGWAGSSWYYFRYMDATNDGEFVSNDAQSYWKDVDLYLGGSEHATGHLLYSRFWNNFLYDLGLVKENEAFKKLVNQGMIQGRSNFVYRVEGTTQFVSHGLRKEYKTTRLHVDVNIVDNDVLDTEAFKAWRPDFANAEFILEDGKYICGSEVEKMSKSKFNVVNPDDIVEKHGADTLRLYEMFLGPLEQSKPWNTNGIDGVHKFLKKLWKLFYNNEGELIVQDAKPSDKELKTLHGTIKKITADLERYSLNTSVSNFMICVNELTSLKSSNKSILSDFLILLAPYAPHIVEELWEALGNTESITYAVFPKYEEKYLQESAHSYPIMINGKKRTEITFDLSKPNNEIQAEVLENEVVQKWLEGQSPKKIIVVPKKIINVVK